MSVERVTDEPLTIAEYAILDEPGEQQDKYREALGLFELADRIGVDGVWVRQFHLRSGRFPGGLPSPLVFLAALASRTTRLRLGTAAITLPLESPLRVAEDAAVLDAVSGGRLELGFANGGGLPGLAELFGRGAHDGLEERKAAYVADLDRVVGILRGEPLDEVGSVLNPPAAALADRIWEATLTERSGREVGERGHGVLIGTTQTVPGEVTARAYYEGLERRSADHDGVRPRVGVATLIYPAADRATALREAQAGIERKYEWGREFLPPATTLAEKAASINLHYGTSEDIVASIAAHPAFRYATQLLVQTELFYDGYAHRADALEQFVTEVAPELGWHAPAVVR